MTSKQEHKKGFAEIIKNPKLWNVVFIITCIIVFIVLMSFSSKYRLNEKNSVYMQEVNYQEFHDLMFREEKSIVILKDISSTDFLEYYKNTTRFANKYVFNIYYLDINKLSSEDLQELKKQVKFGDETTTIIVGDGKVIEQNIGAMNDMDLASFINENGVI